MFLDKRSLRYSNYTPHNFILVDASGRQTGHLQFYMACNCSWHGTPGKTIAQAQYFTLFWLTIMIFLYNIWGYRLVFNII
jgi:hypothetical protein